MVRVCRNTAEHRRSARTFRVDCFLVAPSALGRRRLSVIRALVALLPLLSAGCQSFSSPLSSWRAAYDGGLIRPISSEEMADASNSGNTQNLFDRWITPRRPATGTGAADGSAPSTLILGSDGWRPVAKKPNDPKADAEVEAAKKLFEQGRFADAEKSFAEIAKNRKGTPWGETAQYYLGESQFQQGKYFYAHDSFELLHSVYPATDYREKLVAREYEIAHVWNRQIDPKTPREKLIPWYHRFDGGLPIIDTSGYALKALEHVRHNDPTGEFADDAAIEIAEYYMKHHDYESGAIYYEQFMNEYPKSPLLQQVQHAAIDARLKGYLGPDYDASGLEKARELVKKTLATFPEQEATYEGLYHTLDVINNAQAEKYFNTGSYYKRVNKVASAEYYFGFIPQRWPGSPWATKAKVELAQLAKMPRTQSKPSKIMIPPGSTDAFGTGGGGGGGMGGGMGGMGGGMGGMGMGGMGMPGGGMGGMGGMM
jgi:outer membrane protein assembly factor BamD (BamD/ComL family)